MWRANLRAAFMVNQMAAHQLRNGGAIVNLFSSLDAATFPSHGGYAITSAAVVALTRALALDLRKRDITVNAVSLDIDEACVASGVAEVVTYLLGGGARGITGHVIHVDDRPLLEVDR
jgi:enoyl-[acyl-carrier-protein] reductase (NADH)